MKIKIKAPAKLNLSLKVGKKRPDGFHPIESIMQSINLCDYITITLNKSEKITLSGNSNIISYDEKNLVWRAIEAYFEELGEMMFGIDAYIEKNIPTEAGLAGGSTDAAATILGLNTLLNEPFRKKELHKICATLGSDINFCLEGGTKKCLGRGEILENAQYLPKTYTLIKPKNFGVSTKKAYALFDELTETSNLENDLEFAIIKKYKNLEELHNLGFKMTGSGSVFFKEGDLPKDFNRENYEIFENIETLEHGVVVENLEI